MNKRSSTILFLAWASCLTLSAQTNNEIREQYKPGKLETFLTSTPNASLAKKTVGTLPSSTSATPQKADDELPVAINTANQIDLMLHQVSFDDRTNSAWAKRPKEHPDLTGVDLVFCDSVAIDTVRSRRKVHYRMLAERCLTEIAALAKLSETRRPPG
jgi:hypothetical protein